MRAAYPETTEHWSTEAVLDSRDLEPTNYQVTFRSLLRLASALRGADYGLVVVQPSAFPPWHWEAISRSLFKRAALGGIIPIARYFGPQAIRGKVAAPIAVWDSDDAPFIQRHNSFLLDRATLYFKRELPTDYWRAFMRTLHRRVPTPRFRRLELQRQRVAKLRPISLGLPFGRESIPTAHPVSEVAKTADVFFAGRIEDSATVRKRGMAELLALRAQGYRIDIPDRALKLDDFLARCARAWLTWSPEGYGYDCFRTYEAAICGSVPVVSRQGIERYKPLREGEHCFYHEVEPGSLTDTIQMALKDRERLVQMGEAARRFVLTEHTTASLARYVAQTTLAAARSKPNANC